MARSFNGSTDVITVGGAASPIPANSDCSFSIWTYQTATTAGNFVLIGIFDNAGTNTNSLFISMGNGSGVTGNILSFKAGNFIQTGPSSTISLNTWNHWLGTFVSSTGAAILYLNGVQTASGTLNAGTPATTRAGIGASVSNTGGANFFTGRAAEAAMWTTVLTAAEASALSQGALPNDIRPGSVLAGFWPIDGLQSPEPDLSGKFNNGVLTGTATAPGPPIMMITPRWPQATSTSTSAAPAASTKFRRTLSPIGTRAGSRQIHGTP